MEAPSSRKLLVLDLDETLVRSSETPISDYDFICRGSWFTVWVKRRPGLDAFLTEASTLYDIAVWSAGGDEYVRAVVKMIMPVIPLVFLYTSKRCTMRYRPLTGDENADAPRQQYVLKDLNKIWRLKTKKYTRWNTVVVDDTWTTYQRNYGNAIRVVEFIGDSNDRELERVMNILRALVSSTNVRTGLKELSK